MEVARTIVDALEEKKGEDILLLDIREVTVFADYFVICSGTSDRMLNALADGIKQKVKEKFQVRGRVEGSPNDGWLLVDFGDVVVHLFSPERRDYYSLEELWEEGKILLRLQ
jgi:ribosome-associated protein